MMHISAAEKSLAHKEHAPRSPGVLIVLILQTWHRHHAQGDPAALQMAPPREDFHDIAFGQLPHPAEALGLGLGIPEWIVKLAVS